MIRSKEPSQFQMDTGITGIICRRSKDGSVTLTHKKLMPVCAFVLFAPIALLFLPSALQGNLEGLGFVLLLVGASVQCLRAILAAPIMFNTRDQIIRIGRWGKKKEILFKDVKKVSITLQAGHWTFGRPPRYISAGDYFSLILDNGSKVPLGKFSGSKYNEDLFTKWLREMFAKSPKSEL